VINPDKKLLKFKDSLPPIESEEKLSKKKLKEIDGKILKKL
jgi:hypothetical protein